MKITPDNIAEYIFHLQSDKNMTLIEAITYIAEENSIEIEKIAELIKKDASLVQKLEEEALRLNMVKKHEIHDLTEFF